MAICRPLRCTIVLSLILLIHLAGAFIAKPTARKASTRIPFFASVASPIRTSWKKSSDPRGWYRQQQHLQLYRALPLFQTTVATVQANNQKNLVATSAAFLTGWADVALVTKYKTFATMMTGNTMWLAQAVVDLKWTQVCFYCTVIAAYMMGVAAFRKMDYSLRKQTLRASALMVLTLFVTSDIVFALTRSKFLPVALLSAGFGIINSIGAEETGTLTFVVTGHMTKLTNMLVDRTKGVPKSSTRRPLTVGEMAAALENMSVTVGFFAGAVCGWLLQVQKQTLQRNGIFSLLGALFGLLFFFLDMEKIGGAWWRRKNKQMLQLDNDGEIRLAVEQDMAVPVVPLVPPPPVSTTNTTTATTTR